MPSDSPPPPNPPPDGTVVGRLSGRPARPAPEPEHALRLPRGAWLAFEQSGGFRFVTRRLVLYRDGRLVVTSSEVSAPVTGRLTDEQMAELRRQLERLAGATPPAATAPAAPDAFAYELAVRVGRTTRRLLADEGRLPPALAPLLDRLKALLRSAEDTGASG